MLKAYWLHITMDYGANLAVEVGQTPRDVFNLTQCDDGNVIDAAPLKLSFVLVRVQIITHQLCPIDIPMLLHEILQVSVSVPW